VTDVVSVRTVEDVVNVEVRIENNLICANDILVEEWEWVTYMKATGIVRRVDDLNRIVVSKEITRKLSISADDGVDISTIGGYIVVKKSKTSKYAIDDLGRLTIPKHIVEKLHIHEGCAMEFFTEDDAMIIKIYGEVKSNDVQLILYNLSELSRLVEFNSGEIIREDKINILNNMSEIRKILVAK